MRARKGRGLFAPLPFRRARFRLRRRIPRRILAGTSGSFRFRKNFLSGIQRIEAGLEGIVTAFVLADEGLRNEPGPGKLRNNLLNRHCLIRNRAGRQGKGLFLRFRPFVPLVKEFHHFFVFVGLKAVYEMIRTLFKDAAETRVGRFASWPTLRYSQSASKICTFVMALFKGVGSHVKKVIK